MVLLEVEIATGTLQVCDRISMASLPDNVHFLIEFNIVNCLL